MDTLVYLHRRLQGVVGPLGLRPLAQKVFRYYAAKSYANDRLASAKQNGRTWLLHPEVALRGEYAEFETIEWLRRVIKPGDTVIDIGANVGQMTLEMAHLVGPAGKVIAVEPGLGNIQMLRRHIEANGFARRVTIIEAACCEIHGGTLEFKIFGASDDTVGSGHTLVINRAPTGPEEQEAVISKVPTVSLDSLCVEHGAKPAVIKVDVEGAELRVLEGARETLQVCHPALRIGFHPFAFDDPSAATLSLFSLLENCGYETAHLSGRQSLQLEEYEFYPQQAFADKI